MARTRLTLDPVALARWQHEADRAATRKMPELLARKRARMARSPHAFLRGSAGLFDRMLTLSPDLMGGPPGGGWIVGDLHVENFGAFRGETAARAKRRDRVVFDLNDLDLAVVGPWRYDLARLTTSLLLAARERGLDGDGTVRVARAALTSWRDAVFGDGPTPAPPAYIQRLVEKVGARTHGSMLADRTTVVRGRRRFTRGERYGDLSDERVEKITRAFARYLAALPDEHRPGGDEGSVVDVAFRVAGTGSLGVLRAAVLTRGRGGDGEWIFDLKETLDPPALKGVTIPATEPAERVVAAMRGCLEVVPRMLGTTRVGRRSMLVRRLSPQEDKVDVADVDAGELAGVAQHLGAVTARAHLRGRDGAAGRAWSDAELDGVLARSTALAGAHVATWLAWCAEAT